MNDDQIKGNWKELKGKIQKNWGKITDDDLEEMKGTRTELIGKVQKSYGKSKEEAEKQVDQFLNS